MIVFFYQIDAQILYFNTFITFLYIFFISVINQLDTQHFCAQSVHETAIYRCDDTRGCIMQFWPPDDEHMVLETCRGMK